MDDDELGALIAAQIASSQLDPPERGTTTQRSVPLTHIDIRSSPFLSFYSLSFSSLLVLMHFA
jgi:hypothetical protein